MDRDHLHHAPTAELRETMGQLHALATAALARMLEIASVYDQRRAWAEDGAPSMAHWLTAEFGMAFDTASEMTRVARELPALPAIGEVFARGELCWDQVRAVSKMATPESDERLAEDAAKFSAGQLQRMARRARPVPDEEEEDAHLRRSLRMRWDHRRHTFRLSGRLPEAEGAVVEKALELIASRSAVDPETGCYEPYDRRCADALVELASQKVASHPDADQATVVVHVDADALDGGEGMAELEAGGAVSAETARRLACDARWTVVVDGPDGLPLGIGRTDRRVPKWLRRQLRFRDGCCRFPGCERKGWLAAHHIRYWTEGGPTDMDNLVLLCQFHHRVVHERGWKVEGNPNGELTFIRPDGTVRATGSPPLHPVITERFFPDDESKAG